MSRPAQSELKVVVQTCLGVRLSPSILTFLRSSQDPHCRSEQNSSLETLIDAGSNPTLPAKRLGLGFKYWKDGAKKEEVEVNNTQGKTGARTLF